MTTRSMTVTTGGNCTVTIQFKECAEPIPIPTTNNADPLHGVRLKIERAKGHVKEINAQIGDWSEPFSVKRRKNGSKHNITFRVRPIPKMLPVMIGEVLSQLKSALDLLTCRLATANNRGTSGVSFPICGTEKEFKGSKTQDKIKNLASAAQGRISDQQPYNEGGNLLLAMNRLRNKDVHIGLLTFITHWPQKPLLNPGTYVDATHNDIGDPHPLEVEVCPIPSFETFREEVIIATCTTALDVKILHNMQPMISIAFSEIEGIEGQPVAVILPKFVALTTRIVDVFDQEFFKDTHAETIRSNK
jgi:hypothetical protein